MTARECALKILLQIERDRAYSNLVLKNLLDTSGLKEKDKSLCTLLVYGVLERRITLDYILSKHSKIKMKKLSPVVLGSLRLGAYQLIYMNKIPESAAVNESVEMVKQSGEETAAGYVNAVLHAVSDHLENLSYPQDDSLFALSVRYSLPVDLIEGFIKDYTLGQTKELLNAFLKPPRKTIRVNTWENSVEECIRCLENENVSVKKHEYLRNALYLENAGNITELNSYKQGRFHLQGISSQLCCAAMHPKPGERVLDLCAAPGGKTVTIAEMMENNGQVVAGDLYEHRTGLIQEQAVRLGLSCIETGVQDATEFNPRLGSFDKVLCDVPCSGLGVLSSKPEIRYKKAGDFAGLPDLQRKILTTAAGYVKPGGTLLYSTCTLRKEENQQVVESFLNLQKNFSQKSVCGMIEKSGELNSQLPGENGEFSLTLFPHIHGTDGFFIAGLLRQG